MPTKDERPYAPDTVESLKVRVTYLEGMVAFLTRAYHAFRNYGVDYQTLPEWQDKSKPEAARKVTSERATDLLWEYYHALNRGLDAALRRAQLRLVKGGKAIEEEANKERDPQ